MFYFHKVAYVQYLGKVDIFHTWVKKISSSLQQCKNYKNRSRFPKVMITNVLPPFFMVHSVYKLMLGLLQVLLQQEVSFGDRKRTTSSCLSDQWWNSGEKISSDAMPCIGTGSNDGTSMTCALFIIYFNMSTQCCFYCAKV